jgi:putative flippase GtrA
MKARFVKFVVSRLLGTVVDTLVLWVLTKFLFFSYAGQYLVAPAISFEVAMFHNYLLSYYFIWHTFIPLKNTRDFFIRLVSYNISTLFGFSIKMGFLLLFERLFGWDVLLCNIAALLISGFVNFFLAEKIVFKKRSPLVVDDN